MYCHPAPCSRGDGSARVGVRLNGILRRCVLAVIAAFIAISPDTAQAIPLTRDVIASTFDEFPEQPNAFFTNFGDEDDIARFIAVDGAGGIIFQADGFDFDSFDNFNGIFSVAQGSNNPTPLVTTGQAAPGGGSFREINNFVANDAGAVAFFADSDGASGLFGINSSGNVSLVIADSAAVSISGESLVGVTANNNVVFTGSIDPPSFNDNGVFKGSIDGGDIQTIAEGGQPVPGLPGVTIGDPTRDRENVRVNAAGDLTFLSGIELENGDSERDGVFHIRDGVTEFFGFQNGPPPNPEDGTSWGPQGVFIAPSGDLAVIAEFETTDGEFAAGVWYGSGGGDLPLITQGNSTGNISTAFGSDGKLFFSLTLENRETLLTFDPGNVEVNALLDDDTETEFGRLRNYAFIGVSNDDAVIFSARSSDGPGGFYAIETDGSLTALVREGDVIDETTIVSLTEPDDGQSAFNGRTLAVVAETGEEQIVLRVVFDSEAPTNFVWTGACGSTNWHDITCSTTNWTGAPGEPSVFEPPGDAPAGDENATIVDATVRIFDRPVTLNSLTATGELQLENTLNLGGTPPIVAFGPERQEDIPPGGPSMIANIRINEIGGGLLSSGETTLTGEGIWGGKIATQGEGVVINDGTLNIVRFSGAALLEGVFSNGGTVTQISDLVITGRAENQGTWRIEGGDLTEPTPDTGSFVNDGTLVNATAGDTTVALNYAGGNNSRIEGAAGNLTLTDGGAFAGVTTIALGDGATAQLDGAGPDPSVFTVTAATVQITPEIQQTIPGVLTVRDTGDAGGKLIVGVTGALNVDQGSRLVIAGSNLELKGGELTGRVEIKKSPGPDNFFSDQGQFNFLAGRFGTGSAAADLLVDTGGFLTVAGEPAANRSLFGNIEVKSSAFQSTDLQIESGAITVAEGGEWRITGGSLTKPTPGSGALINNGTLGKFLAGDATVAVRYDGGDGSKIEGDAGKLFLTGGGAFAGETTIQNGVRATVRLDGAGPDKTVFSVVSAIDPEAVAVVRGVLTVQGVDGDPGQFIIGPNAALNVEQNSRLVVAGTRLVLNGGDLTGKVEIKTLPPSGDASFLFGDFDFESGRLGVAGSRADLSVQVLSRLEIVGASTADRSLVGDVEVNRFGRVIQRTDLRVDNSTITIASRGLWKVEGGSLLSDAASTLTIQGATEPDEDGDVFPGGTFELTPPSSTTVSFAGVLDNLGSVVVNSGKLFFNGPVNQRIGNALTDGKWLISGQESSLKIGSGTIDTIGANATVELRRDGALQNLDLLTNAGRLDLFGTDFTTNNAVFNPGRFRVLNEGSLETGDFKVSNAIIGGRFKNDGELDISFGSRLSTTEFVTNEASKTNIDGRLEITEVETLLSGHISGVGVIVSLGITTQVATIKGGNSPGTLTFDTPLFVAGPDTIFNIEVGGTEAGVSYDLLLFTGDVVLGGTLVFDFIDSFLPDTADLFQFFEVAGQLSGQFDQITVNGLGDAVGFDVIVDPVTGAIILADVVASSVSVPEPPAMGLLLFGFIFLGWMRWRRSSFAAAA